jgi:hypothetical protein
MAEHCIWSNRSDPGTREVTLGPAARGAGEQTVHVCPAHEGRVRGFHAFSQRYGGWFLALLGANFVLALLLVLLGSGEATVAGAVFLTLGITVAVFPFATPQTVQALGMRSSIILGRVLAFLLIMYGGFLLATST